MRRIALVRRRDGQTEPFDPGRIEASVQRALDACGAGDPLLAGEIASIVALFLEKTFFDEIPTTEQVEEMLEKVLVETGHAAAARAYIRQRDRDQRRRDAGLARDDLRAPTLFGPATLQVEDLLEGVVRGFARERLARWIAAEAEVRDDLADEVAGAVELRLREHQVARPTLGHLQALAETELLDRGLVVDPRPRGGVRLSHGEVAEALDSVDAVAVDPALHVGERVVRAHALAELLPGRVARAHLDGELHVHGLTRPNSVVALAVDAAALLGRGGASGSTEPWMAGPRWLPVATHVLARRLGALARVCPGGLLVRGLPWLLGPVAHEGGPEVGEQAAWSLAHAFAAGGGHPQLELDLSPPLDADPTRAATTLGGTDADFSRADCWESATVCCSALFETFGQAGAPSRGPRAVVAVSEAAASRTASRRALWAAVGHALGGGDVVFRMERDPSVARAPSAALTPEGLHTVGCFGRATLNLPRAAARAGRGNLEAFLRLLDEVVAVAAEALRSRREWLVDRLLPGGPLGLLRRELGVGIADLHGSVAVTGLNEAVLTLLGTELHECDEPGERAARRILGYLAVQVRRLALEHDLPLALDADPSAAVARRLRRLDRSHDGHSMDDWLPRGDAYTPGIALRAGAPVDLALRLDREEALHAAVTTATVQLGRPRAEWGGPESALNLLSKLTAVGACHQVELSAW